MANKKGEAGSAKKPSGKNKIFKDDRYPLGKYIVTKFVDKTEINLWRDLPTAYKLINKYPEELFWRLHVPCDKKIKNLSVLLLNEKAKDKLKMFYNIYRSKINIEKKLDIVESVEYKLEDSSFGEDKEYKKKNRSVLDFCRKSSQIPD